MDKELILRNAETFEAAARDSMHESNKQIFALADLLIKIAFGIGGLAATFVVSNDEFLLYSRWGIVFISASILLGGLQMFIDSLYFKKNGKKLIATADRWKWWAVNKDDSQATHDAKQSVDALKDIANSSPYLPLAFQVVFVCMGAVFILIDVFNS